MSETKPRYEIDKSLDCVLDTHEGLLIWADETCRRLNTLTDENERQADQIETSQRNFAALTARVEVLEALLKRWLTSYCGPACETDEAELPPWKDTDRALAKPDEPAPRTKNAELVDWLNRDRSDPDEPAPCEHEPVMAGKHGLVRCKKCGEEWFTGDEPAPYRLFYCPECGAKHVEEKRDEGSDR